MKKVIASVLLFAIVASLLCVSAFAVNKSDLLTEAAKSPVYKYVKVAVENAAKNVEITDEQAEKLMPIVKKAVSILPEDKGPGARINGKDLYTLEQYKAIMQCVDEACAILNFTYTTTPSAKPAHAGDIILRVYDTNKTLIFEFDGDLVADTDVDETSGSVAFAVAGAALVVLGLGAAVVARKRYNANTAA